MFVLMEVKTLGVAREPGLEGAHALRQRLSAGRRAPCGSASTASSWTSRRWFVRGGQLPAWEAGRAEMCPACGNRRVTVVFEPPSNAQVEMGDAGPRVALNVRLDVEDSVSLIGCHLCANDFEGEVICQPIVRW
jgi:hypothetical protein